MSARSATTIASITLGAAAVAGIGYCFYFDHQRRNNPEFRKGLKKQQKQIAAAAEARTKAEKEKHKKYIANALREIQNEEPPVTPEASEAYFQEHVAEAERLALLGSESHAESAVEFFKALRVYPQPVELLMIYQKVCPPPIFALVLEMTSMGEAAGPGRTGAGAGNVLGGIDAEDIDDDSPNSPNARSQSSGNDWEQLSQGAV